MAEPKRITLTQIGTVEVKESKEKRRLTNRFTLSLDRSTDKTCPEFSYNELLKNRLGDPADPNDNDDPFASRDRADQQKLEALAKSFEEKYALPKAKKKKGGHNRIQEFVDLGDGYDEADPFIDNTEAYDELVPSCLTTQHGGFYINSGKLDFRVVSDSDDEVFPSSHKKNHKKNRIASDSDSESVPKKKFKKFKGDDDLRKKKRKKLSSTDSMGKPLLKKKRFDRDSYKGLKIKKKKKNMSQLLDVPHVQNGSTFTNGTHIDNDRPEACMTTEARHNMEMAIDSVISQAHRSDDDSDDEITSPKDTQSGNLHDIPKLPEPLPPRISDLVVKLKQAASECEQGKKKFFTNNVNQMLLSVENGSRQLPPSIRNGIYSHLAAFLPCGKETLIKRAKKLHANQYDSKLQDPIAKLKEAINKAMPALMERHQAELHNVQLKKRKREAGSTESDEEGEKKEGEKQKRIMAPRRKFEYSDETRRLLNQIVQIKMNHYELSRSRSQTPEEYLKSFMEQEIMPLWPQGWMQLRQLYKESRMVHTRWTTPGIGNKPRKPLSLVVGNRTPGSAPSTPTASKSAVPLNVSPCVNQLIVSSMSAPSVNAPIVVTSTQQQQASSSTSSSDSSSSDVNHPTTTMSLLDYASEEPNRASISNLSANISSENVRLNSTGSFGFSPPVSNEKMLIQDNPPKAKTEVIQDNLPKTKTEVIQFNPPKAKELIQIPAEPKQEVSAASFLEKFYQFASGSQNVSSTSSGQSDRNTFSSCASLLNSNMSSHLSRHMFPPKTDVKKTQFSSANSAMHRGIDPSTKPHLAAALKGVYTPNTVSNSQVSSTSQDHSGSGKSQTGKPMASHVVPSIRDQQHQLAAKSQVTNSKSSKSMVSDSSGRKTYDDHLTMNATDLSQIVQKSSVQMHLSGSQISQTQSKVSSVPIRTIPVQTVQKVASSVQQSVSRGQSSQVKHVVSSPSASGFAIPSIASVNSKTTLNLSTGVKKVSTSGHVLVDSSGAHVVSDVKKDMTISHSSQVGAGHPSSLPSLASQVAISQIVTTQQVTAVNNKPSSTVLSQSPTPQITQHSIHQAQQNVSRAVHNASQQGRAPVSRVLTSPQQSMQTVTRVSPQSNTSQVMYSSAYVNTQPRLDSKSPSRAGEPKFGGLTLSEIQEQTLKAAQQASQYTSQVASTTLYRSAESPSMYGAAQLSNYGVVQSRPASYTSSHQSPVPSHRSPDFPTASVYGLGRNPATLEHQNTTTAQNPSQHRY